MNESQERIAAVATEAAGWYLDLQAGESAGELQARFADWLRRSPVHVEEYLRVVALQSDLGQLTDLAHADVATLLREARDAAADAKVVGIRSRAAAAREVATAATADVPTALARVTISQQRRPRTVARLSVAAAVLLAGSGLMFHTQLRDAWLTRDYSTGIGEQRSIELRDGSQVRINVDSSMAVRVDMATREIQLNDGEALFEVAKDPAHPFRVRTPQAVIEAKGTQFDVQVRNGRTVVVLLEGQVQVTPPGSPPTRAGAAMSGTPRHAVLLDPGQEVTVGSGAAAAWTPRKADLAVATAWTRNRLVFDDEPLTDVVTEFNRYSSVPVVIDDPTIGGIRVTTSFAATDTELFARSIAAAGNLRVTHRADGTWHIDRP